MALVVKNLPANARDAGSTPRSWRSPKKEMVTPSSIPAWKIPWTEETGGGTVHGLQRDGYGQVTEHKFRLLRL